MLFLFTLINPKIYVDSHLCSLQISNKNKFVIINLDSVPAGSTKEILQKIRQYPTKLVSYPFLLLTNRLFM